MSISVGLVLVYVLCVLWSGIQDIPYEHFFHTPISVKGLSLEGEVGFLPVYVKTDEGSKILYLGTEKGLLRLRLGSNDVEWENIGEEYFQGGGIFDIKVNDDGNILVGAWNGLYIIDDDKIEKVKETGDIPVAVVCVGNGKIIVGSPEGIWIKRKEESWQRQNWKKKKSVRDIAIDNAGNVWIATGGGLFLITNEGKVKHYGQNEDIFDAGNPDTDLVSSNVSAVCVVNDEIWAGGLGGITVLKEGKVIKRYAHTNFPGVMITKIVYDKSSEKIWIGTNNGLVCLIDGDIQNKKVFRSRRWLLNDKVFDIFLGSNNVYISTAGGVSCLSIQKKTLAEKAEYFEKITQERHTREPGIVEKCRLRVPGDLSTWEPEDDDNDGGYTNMYLAGLALQYAVTKDIQVQQRAKKIFSAILFLEEVTEMPGFMSRTVVPSDWTRMHDPNEEISPQRRALLRVLDPRYKPVEVRWRKSKDGKWLWKGDTSSDEITAHFFGWGIYYDLCADEEDKTKLRALVSRVMDKIIADGYVLKDIDGTHTRWGVWAPERLKHDPDWSNERGINALEVLSYLKTAYHITGDEKYQKEYERLLIDEDYVSLIRKAKNYGPASRTHIDDELLAFTYPALFRYEKEERWLEIYRESIQHWYKGVENEHCPLFNFIYAWCMGNDPHLDRSVETMREIPYDLVNWTIDNRSREDVSLVREPILEDIQTSRLLPPGETGVIRWDKNRWQAVQGDGGHTEWAPTFYLFPYWLGRYLGLIE